MKQIIDEQLFNYLNSKKVRRETPPLSFSQLCAELGVGEKAIKSARQRLAAAGRISWRVPTGRAPIYKIIADQLTLPACEEEPAPADAAPKQRVTTKESLVDDEPHYEPVEGTFSSEDEWVENVSFSCGSAAINFDDDNAIVDFDGEERHVYSVQDQDGEYRVKFISCARLR